MNANSKYFRENGSEMLAKILSSEQVDDDNQEYYPLYGHLRFYFLEGDKYIAVDNGDCCCYVEEFDTAEEAIAWLTEEYW